MRIFIPLLLSFLLFGALRAQISSEIKIPTGEEVVQTGHVFNHHMPREYFIQGPDLKWNYKALIPEFIHYQTIQKNESGELTYFVNDKEKWIVKNEGKVLTLQAKVFKVDFVKSGELRMKVKGNAPVFAQLDMNQRTASEYDLEARVAFEELTKEFKGLSDKTDSVIIRFHVLETGHIRERGNLSLYHYDGKAVCVETITRTEVELDIKYEHAPKWYHFNFNASKLPRFLIDTKLGLPVNTYAYYIPSLAFPLFSYQTFKSEVYNIRIQDIDNPLNLPMVYFDEKKIIATPNPTYGPTQFILFNYPPGYYRLDVFNITGKRLMNKNFNTAVGQSFEMDVSELPKGVYLYKFVDFLGRKSTTQRLMRTVL